MKKYLNNKGQTMLEIVGALGLLIVVIAAFTITTANGLRNSQQAKNQTMASQLAQDAADKVRNIAKLNCYVSSSGDHFWNTSFSTGTSFAITNPHCSPSNPTDFGLTQSSLDTIDPDPVDTDFTRQITISDDVLGKTVRVVVRVVWNDASGAHDSTVSTIVGDY